MSRKERARLTIMTGVTDGELTVVQAAALMGVSYRQDKRIWQRYQAEGDAGLVHRLRGKPSARRKPAALRELALIVRRLRNGRVQLVHRGQQLKWRGLPEGTMRKQRAVKKKPEPRPTQKKSLPAADHPWRRPGVGAGRRYWNGIRARGEMVRAAARLGVRIDDGHRAQTPAERVDLRRVLRAVHQVGEGGHALRAQLRQRDGHLRIRHAGTGQHRAHGEVPPSPVSRCSL